MILDKQQAEEWARELDGKASLAETYEQVIDLIAAALLRTDRLARAEALEGAAQIAAECWTGNDAKSKLRKKAQALRRRAEEI